MKNKTITHIIFDMDGILLDTEPFYTTAAQQIVGEFGKTFTWALKAKTMGRKSIESAKLIVEALELPITPEEYLRRREGIMTDIFSTAQPKPGAKKLTAQLKERNIPLAVATSSARTIFEQKITHHKEWFSIFDVIINGDDPELKRGKPDPDIFLLAAKKMNANPESCMVIEDSLTGVAAGLAAKMMVVAVPDPNMDKELFGSAHRVLASLEEFDLLSLLQK